MLDAAARLRESLGEGVKALGAGEERRTVPPPGPVVSLPLSPAGSTCAPRSQKQFQRADAARPLSSWLKACSKPLSPPCVCLSRPRASPDSKGWRNRFHLLMGGLSVSHCKGA